MVLGCTQVAPGKKHSLGGRNSLAAMSSPLGISPSNLFLAKYLHSKKGSCSFKLVVAEAIPLPQCLLGFLTPQSELVHWEDASPFSSALHWVMAPRVESASMRDAVHQPHKSLTEPKEMLRCLEAFTFFFF